MLFLWKYQVSPEINFFELKDQGNYEIMPYSKRNIIKFYKNCGLKTSSRPFCVCKQLSTTSIGK